MNRALALKSIFSFYPPPPHPATSKRTKPTQITVKTGLSNHRKNHNVTCKNKLRRTHLGITPEKAIRNWNIDVKVKCFKYFDFHLYELFV